MPNILEVSKEIQQAAQDPKIPNPLDHVRRKYLAKIQEITKRNVISYYSSWLDKGVFRDTMVNDKDKNAFMACIHQLDKKIGLDLILHTPGGDVAATESLVDYLHSMFGNDIRCIVPQISMSAGTMIAMACKEIMMGAHSNLGPIDPQYNGIPCQAVVEEFDEAKKDIQRNPSAAAVWQPIIAKYHPTFLGSCKNAIIWSKELAEDWLGRNMCSGNAKAVSTILGEFADHAKSRSHNRHISKSKCKSLGMKISDLETDNNLQDAVLTTHHAYMLTFTHSNALKIVENHKGVAIVELAKNPQQSPPTQKTS